MNDLKVVKEQSSFNNVDFDVYFLVCDSLKMKIKINSKEKYALDLLVNNSNSNKQEVIIVSVGTILQTIITAITTFLGGVGSGTLDFFNSITSNSDGTMSNLLVFILSLVGITIGLAVIRSIWALIGGYRRAL